ncbi:MAG: 2-amino-4-hydroxy-6-hydroxymethyldihydropteridine diphosphokinase [Deferribacterales bacterium]
MSRKNSVILGLGSNLGSKSRNICDAVRLIGGFCDIISVSPVYKTESLLKDDQDSYFNACLTAETNLPPQELLHCIKTVEKRLGRTVTGRWYTRVMDIDIIDYNGEPFESGDLIIPHPQMENRSFVLYPLMDICPQYTHPVSCRSVSDMVKILKDDLGIIKLGELVWR